MDRRVLIEKMFNSEQKAIRFIEEYYARELNEPKLRIVLDLSRSGNSYYSIQDKVVSIAANNLLELFVQSSRVSFKMFYTILIHEIGHAIYTSPYAIPTPLMNILEDNRLEFHISLWNKRVRFDVVRFVLQDEQLNNDFGLRNSETSVPVLALGLFRTIDNSLYVNKYSRTPNTKSLLDKAFALENKFVMNSKKAFEFNEQEFEQMVNIEKEIEGILLELQKEFRKPTPPQPQKQKSSGGQNQNEQEQEDKQEEQKQEEEKPQQETYRTKNKQEEEKDIEELKEEIEEIYSQNSQVKQEVLNGVGTLVNRDYKDEQYRKIDIQAFKSIRSSGIKGSGNETRLSGNASQLSLRRYARRGFEKNVKPFDKPSEFFGKGGKTSSVLFYLDISGSMMGHRIKIATDYLKSFYDVMYKHLNIRFMAFGENTYELGRNELELKFIAERLEGSTRPTLLRLKPREHLILITDGEFNNPIPEEHKRKATFVVIGNSHAARILKENGCSNVVSADDENISLGLDKATNFIRTLVGGK